MNWTLFLAVWGAATGTIATAATVWTLARDRARIEVAARPDFRSTHPNGEPGPYLGWLMVISNEGRQPVTIHEAGFAADWKTAGRWPRKRTSPTIFTLHEELPTRLEPGEPLVLRHEADREEVNPEWPLRAFAEIRNRVIWAEPEDPAYVRLVRDQYDKAVAKYEDEYEDDF